MLRSHLEDWSGMSPSDSTNTVNSEASATLILFPTPSEKKQEVFQREMDEAIALAQKAVNLLLELLSRCE